jgi:hypothetical protein
MSLHSIKADGSYDYISVDDGLIYVRNVDDLNSYLLNINNTK